MKKKEVINFCFQKKINIFCVMSHLISSDEIESKYNMIQKKNSKKLLNFFQNLFIVCQTQMQF